MRIRKPAPFCVAACLPISEPPPLPADTLPDELTDAESWRMVTEFSEPGGQFPYQNFVSNERAYQAVLPELTQRVPSDGVYLGVAKEENFTYIAALGSKLTFIIDIQRQNMVEHLTQASRLVVDRLLNGPGTGHL